MTRLHQILAVEKDIRRTAKTRETQAHRDLQTPQLMIGITRSYRPINDEDDTLPDESTLVQVRSWDLIRDVQADIERMFDLVATKDFANTEAKADIVVDNQVLVTGVPATYLLWLEKELTDLHTFITKLPVLDPSQVWEYDAQRSVYATQPVETHRTTKIPTVLLKAEATDKHPAQTEVYNRDVTVGFWSTTRLSGALPSDVVRALEDRVDDVRMAVREARTRANEIEVNQQHIAGNLLDYIFEPISTIGA